MRCCRRHKKPAHAESEYLPLDGGHGWAIVAGGALTHFVLVGMARCLGIIFLALQTKFNTSAQETAWATALFNTTRSLIAPVCGKLVVRFGCRAMTIIGSLVLFSGLLISAFATNIYYVYVSFGILTGSGGAMVFTSVYVIVGQYFDKKKGKAMGFATLGSGLGNVILAPLITLFVLHYGWFGAMLLLGALQLNHIVAALLYVPLSKISKLKPEYADLVKEVGSEVHIEKGQGDCLKPLTSEIANGDMDVRDTENGEKMQNKADSENLTTKETGDQDKTQTDLIIRVSPQKECAENVHNESAKNQHPERLCCNLTFIIYGLVIMCLQAVVPTFLIFLPSLAKEHGANDTQAALALSVMGIADMVGRFVSGFVYDLKNVRENRRFVYCFNSMMFAVATGCMALMPHYIAIVTMTAITGLFEGGAHSQRMTVLSEFVRPEQVATAVGMVIFCQGIGNIWGPPAAGALRDAYGTSAFGYVFVGATYVLFILLFVLRLLVSSEKAAKKTQQ